MDKYQRKEPNEGFSPFYEKYSIDWDSLRDSIYRTGWRNPLEPIEINGHILQVEELQETGQREATIQLTLGNSPYMSIKCDNTQQTFWVNLVSYFGYDNHWVVEYLCNGQYGIFLDRQELNETYGYSSSFALYLVSGKLFFFFKRDQKLGFYYDGTEYPLNFNEISYHLCCMWAEDNPRFHADKMTFVGFRGEVQYYVIMGILDQP